MYRESDRESQKSERRDTRKNKRRSRNGGSADASLQEPGKSTRTSFTRSCVRV